MASIFILFPKDNSEYVPVALQHFQWAVERFEAMSERNLLAAAARRVLLAIHYRLEKALNVRAPLGTKNASSTTETSGIFSGHPELQQSQNNKTTAPSVSSTTGESPSQLTNNTGPGSSSGSVSTRGTSIFTTPGGESGEGGPSATGAFTIVGGAVPIDPGLTGGDNSATMTMTNTSDWSLPEDFDWSSIQPVYAMADVAYNDLMGFSNGGKGGEDNSNSNKYAVEGGGGGGGTASMPHWAGGTPLLNDVPATVGAGGDGWMFGGDFGDDSVWSLLNQYPPPY